MSEDGRENAEEAGGDVQARVEELEAQKELVIKLAAAGARDIETAVLVGMSRLGAKDGAGVDEVVEGMRKEKGYLFGEVEERRERVLPGRTSGVRQRRSEYAGAMERAAKRAAASGSRADLQEYLRLRRTGR